MLIEVGFNKISDVWQAGDMIEVDMIAARTGRYASLWFEYNATKTAIINLMRRGVNIANLDQIIPIDKFTPKTFRSIITKDKYSTPCSSHFWRHRYNYTVDKHNWSLAHNATKEERLRLLHWKILHNIYPTNILLKKMKIRDNDLCSLCYEIDYIEHFFLELPTSQTFLECS